MITSECKSMLSKVSKEVLSPDFDLSKLILKTTSIFSKEIDEIIDLFENYQEELGYNDTISIVENRLKPVIIAFSLKNNSVQVYDNDYYEEFLFTILNNKSIELLTIDFKKIVEHNTLIDLLLLESEERSSEIHKIFTHFFENNFSKTVSDVLMSYSNLINNIVDSQDENELSESITEFNDLIRKNSLPMSILTKNELRHYLTFVIKVNKKNYIPPFLITKTYHYLEDKQFKDEIKELVLEIISEFIQSKLFTEAIDGFFFVANYRLFVDNSSFFKTLKNLWSLLQELDFKNYNLDFYSKPANLSDSFFIDVFSDFVEALTEIELDSAGDLLAFILENEIFVGDTNLESTTLDLSKKLGKLNHKVSVKVSGYFLNDCFDSFSSGLLNSKSVSSIELQFENYSIIRLFQMEYSQRINELLDVLELNDIKLLLNKESTNSLCGLLIGLENGLVISQDENNKAHLERFLSFLG